MNWGNKMKKVYHDIILNLWYAGQDEVTLNGRSFRLVFEDATRTVEVCEVIGDKLEYLFTFTHESEVRDWLEELFEESVKIACG